jgi:NAD(P)H dehydrogenase (quinone)
MYAITGVSGHVGRAAAQILLEKKLPVRAVIRDPAKAQEWKDKGADVIIADLNDTQALRKAFRDTEGVFVMTPPLFNSPHPIRDHDRMLIALTEAISSTKPQKLVYLSSVGAHLPHGTGVIKKLYDMEQSFHELEIPSAGIRAAWFMENFASAIISARDCGKLLSFLHPTDMAIPMVSTKDISGLAADLLTQNWKGHRIVELEGPCLYSADDVASSLAYFMNRMISAEAIPGDRYAAVYELFGFTQAAAQMMAEMNEGFNNGRICFEMDGHEQHFGKTLLEDVLKGVINT